MPAINELLRGPPRPLQVRAKGMALVHFMGQQQGAQRTYALLTLANKLLSQCEAQVCVGGRWCGWCGQVIVHLGGAFLWGAAWACAFMCP